MTDTSTYVTGGVRAERPFRIRRLGHVGVDAFDLGTSLDFFVRDLGLWVSDEVDIRNVPGLKDLAEGLPDPRGMFLTTGSDHHTVVLLPREIARARRDASTPDEITNGQVSFQVNGLDEVVAAKRFLEDNGFEVPRIGRDMPGSNWHTYFRGPDDLVIELYYGMEQIGWSRTSKPRALYTGALYTGANDGTPQLPVSAEYEEVDDALRDGADLGGGQRHTPRTPATHMVGGVRLPRPFRIVGFGPVSFFVDDVDRSQDFFSRLLGLAVTETADCRGHRCVFLRAGSEHHCLALYPKALRAELGLEADNTNFALGFQVGDYDQLRRAARFLHARGWKIRDGLPPELHCGIDRAVFAEDGRGRRVMLHYYMERIGWDGRPRPAGTRPAPDARSPLDWPETVDAPGGDVYGDAPLLGPLA